jgi:hypothetical protein
MEDEPGPGGLSGESEIRVHPLVAKLIEASEGDEGVVELRGYIGPAREGDDPVPLYTTLELTERILVPRDAIIHVEEPERDPRNEEPTRVYVKGSAELRLISCSVTTIRADEASATFWMGVRLLTHRKGPQECGSDLSECLESAGGDFYGQIACIHDYAGCMARVRRRRR